MHWEPTDQFGTLHIGASLATSVSELENDLLSLIAELRQRHDGALQLTLDYSYGEVNGPDPDQVSHILEVSWLKTLPPEQISGELVEALRSHILASGHQDVKLVVA